MNKVIQRKWYTITNLAPDEGKSNETDPALIRMSGIVGLEIDDIVFAEDLDFLGAERALDVEINTPGGIVDVGVAIYNLLKKHKGPVSTRTNGQAASAGTLIFLGGDKDKRIVETGATLMVHNPGRPFAFETLEAKELRAAASQLDVVREAIIDIYQEATGIDRDTIGVLMDETTFMTGADAVELGFASHSTASADQKEVVSATNQMVRMLNSAISSRAGAPRATQAKTEETPMADNVNAGDVKARIKAIMTSDAGKRNTAQAEILAFDTELSAEQAIAVLAAAPCAPKTPEPVEVELDETVSEPVADEPAADEPAADEPAAPAAGAAPAVDNSFVAAMNAAAPKPLAVGDSPADPGDDADADLEARVNRILNNAKSFGVK